MSKASKNFIGFPPPLLGEEAYRLPVLYDDGDLLALAKPVGIGIIQDNWYPKTPLLVEAIRYQAATEKGELVRLGVSTDGLFAVHDLDAEVAGFVLFSRNAERAEALKNEIGSQGVEFEFHLLCAQNPSIDSVFCDLPLARHFKDKRMMVSHQTGKKSETQFQLIEPYGRFSLWKASTRYVRRHQIMIHAAESGLKVVGDHLYGKQEELFLSDIKRGYRPNRNKEETPLYSSVSIVLAGMKLADGTIIAPEYPQKFLTQLKYVRKFSH